MSASITHGGFLLHPVLLIQRHQRPGTQGLERSDGLVNRAQQPSEHPRRTSTTIKQSLRSDREAAQHELHIPQKLPQIPRIHRIHINAIAGGSIGGIDGIAGGSITGLHDISSIGGINGARGIIGGLLMIITSTPTATTPRRIHTPILDQGTDKQHPHPENVDNLESAREHRHQNIYARQRATTTVRQTGKIHTRNVDNHRGKGRYLRCEIRQAGVILNWLKEDYALGRGHGMALVHVIKKGPRIDTTHVGTSGSHRDATDTLWLDGKGTKPGTGTKPE